MRALLPFAFASLLPAVLLLLACGFGGIWPLTALLSITVTVFILDRRTGDDWALPQDMLGHVLLLCMGGRSRYLPVSFGQNSDLYRRRAVAGSGVEFQCP